MKTSQVIQRQLMGCCIRQDYRSGFFCINDLRKMTNTYMENKGHLLAMHAAYIKAEKTQEFINELIIEEDIANPIKLKGGINAGTWVHPLIFLDYVIWLNPKLKVKTYKWVDDNLVLYCDKSRDSYKELTWAMMKQFPNLKPKDLSMFIKSTAYAIKEVLNVDDWNTATELQLKYRNKIQQNMKLLIRAGINIQKAFDLAIEQIRDDVKDLNIFA